MSLTNTFHKIIERLETENMNKRFLTFKHSKTHYFQPLMVTKHLQSDLMKINNSPVVTLVALNNNCVECET
ncbi:uncharacterized protein OCT59_014383 [Rhizophagus irregularis]|uniref:uncharacterized protein n=1 Tax=Rhizophagus irregularis TaxID=588596 RepID=UPI00332220A0|nr:hypothetical protein OCT59_014383 [Rhizophagus irregularis]